MTKQITLCEFLIINNTMVATIEDSHLMTGSFILWIPCSRP